MLNVHSFVFNAFQENTYIVYDDSGSCAIFDPGMSNHEEEAAFTSFITQHNLNPIALYNTHCHIDHVLGNHFVFEKYGLIPQFHEGEVPVLVAVQNMAPMYGFRYETSPIPELFLEENQTVKIGKYMLELLFIPGHSPAHLCFYSAENRFVIGGDVLFRNSIGRTDLPGGDHQQLLDNIRQKMYTLPDETVVYPGHGPSTTIGFEKETNPFVRG
ncbi:MBL fold metallo-hydrolase [Sphingobacterium gobiense]|uniref:MBL fold hydrolase n=1 Tax=Sphingobacterium gobiense TaxID=1382456 RepID=A0A2S9JG11_9SPHI|nr:MBL fold metallo-hydrolase [Sphingobacterium gobiense]PRD51879.1 MBL fold hydrolase [Sphingobacterium gobiense]